MGNYYREHAVFFGDPLSEYTIYVYMEFMVVNSGQPSYTLNIRDTRTLLYIYMGYGVYI